MSTIKVVTVPDPVLTTKCKKVEKFDQKLKEIAQDLVDTVLAAKNPEAAGIAAPQIGIPLRICVVRNFIPSPDGSGKEISQEFILVNPKIISNSTQTELDWEGCLSIPNTYGRVLRFSKIKIKAFDIQGQEFRINASGFFARIIQHELDHLDGVLFTTLVVGKTLSDEQLDNLLLKVG